MASQAFEDKDIQYAYNTIHDFFDSFGLSAVQHIETMLKAAISYKTRKKAVPSRLLFLTEKLEELFAAAFTINNIYARKEQTILSEPTEPDMALHQNFAGTGAASNIWSSFPRNLTAKQYRNPYKAIKKFTAYMPEHEWKQTIKDCLEYALSANLIYEVDPSYDILTIPLRLLQLVEACRLINIRTTPKKKEPLISQEDESNQSQ